LHFKVPAQLMKADKSLRDAIKKMAESKQTTDSIGKALAVTLQPGKTLSVSLLKSLWLKQKNVLIIGVIPVLQNAFREMFLSIVVPGFDKATKALLGGIATAFNKVN
jgi:hypothetical protein